MLSTGNFRRYVLPAIVILAVVGLTAAQDGAGTWKDNDTGLTWATKDNGMEITQGEARSYCASLKAGGLEWRLPTIEEVEAIYDKDKKPIRIKGTIELSEPRCVLTSSTNRTGDIWTFCFSNGSKNLGGGSSSCGTQSLALCVSGESK